MNSKTLMLAAIIALSAAGNALAHCGTCGVGEPKAAEGAHTMANKVCLCGMALSEDAGKTVHVEYNGHTYHFCAQSCADAFNADPEGSIKKLTEAAAKE